MGFFAVSLATSIFLFVFAFGQVVAFSSIMKSLDSYLIANSQNNCIDFFYTLPDSIAFPIGLTREFSFFILEATALVFFSLAILDLIKKKGVNKFYLVSFTISIAAKIVFFWIIG